MCVKKFSAPQLPHLPLSGSLVAEQIGDLPLKKGVTVVQKRFNKSHYVQSVAIVAVVAHKTFFNHFFWLYDTMTNNQWLAMLHSS